MTNAETYRLLILTESQNDAESLISLFRNAGHATRAHRITSAEDLRDHLDDHAWDLLISDDKHSDLSFAEACQIIIDTRHDVPAILLVDTNTQDTIMQGFGKGAVDVIASSATEHLLQAAAREIRNTRERLLARQANIKLQEVMQRAEQLMADTREAIAYVADGMHIEGNEAYAEIFGYENPEDLAALPIIDLIADQDQDKFKAFLRHYGRNQDDQAEFAFTGLRTDGGEFSAVMVMSNSSYDGEPCTQILIRTSAGEGITTNGPGTLDLATNLPNRYHLAEQIGHLNVQVNNGLGAASLMVIAIDHFNLLMEKHRLSGGDRILRDAAEVIQPLIRADDLLTRLGDGTLALLTRQKAEDALQSALSLTKAFDDHICDLGGQTLQYSCTIGIAPANQQSAEDIIDQANHAIVQIRQQGEGGTAAVYLAERRPEKPRKADYSSTLNEALEQKRLFLLYQPIISLRGDSREHYEVFCRLVDENDRELRPQEFLSDATDTKLDRWVILEATKKLSAHRADGHDTRIIINLSVFALSDESLIAWIGVALKAANLPANSLVFQFVEEDLSRNLKQAKETLTALTDLGCLVSISRFGRTGSDPIKTLRQVKTHFVKIDGDFILSIQDNQGDPQVLKALVSSIAEQTALSIVPCVENASILATLWQLGVNYIEGNYLQAPSRKMDYEFTEIA